MIEIVVNHIPWPYPKWVKATTIWPIIVYEREAWSNPAIRAHERYHWKDQMRWLVLPWFIAYLVLLPFYGGGRRHPLERKAYRIQARGRWMLNN
jgi:hypothetical protein